MSVPDLNTHIIIEDTNRKECAAARAKALSAKTNMIEDRPAPKRYEKKPDHKKNKSNFSHPSGPKPTFKKKGNCFVYGRSGHHTSQCRHGVKNDNPPKTNITEGEDTICAVISQVNLVTNVSKWVVDSGTTRHIYANKNAFSSYSSVGDGEEQVYLGDSRTTYVLRKGKVLLKITSGKTLALSDVLHVSSISIALLRKVWVKVSFKSNKIVMTKNNVFVGKGYCDQGLFELNASKIINGSVSSAYIVDSYDIWHARLGHVNSSYVIKLQQLELINMHDKQSMKCDVCVESKITKKVCHSVERQTELLGLIHTDLVDLKQTMSRCDKNYFVTFIDDYSRYTKVYLMKHKDEAFDMFLSYKTEVENQSNKKIKRIRSDRGGEYVSFNDYCVKEGIIHEATPPYSPESNRVAERKNRTLKEMMNAMLISSNAPNNLWGGALLTACFFAK